MVRETSTTSETGAYSLAGADSGFVGFVQAGIAGEPVVYRASLGTDWEVCIGTVTDGTPDILSRDVVLERLVAGTYLSLANGDSPTPINWADSSAKTIRLIHAAEALTKDRGWFLPHLGQQLDTTYHYSLAPTDGNVTLIASRQLFFPHYHARRAKIGINCRIATGEASALLDLGLYDNVDGRPLNLLESSTGIDIAASGNIEFTTTSIYNPGWYWLSYNTNAGGTAQMRGNARPGPFYTWLAGMNDLSSSQLYMAQIQTYASGLEDPIAGSMDAAGAGHGILSGRPKS